MKTDDSPQKIADQIIAGASIDYETACALACFADQQAVWTAADTLRRYFMGNRFHLCSIINARSGNCTENCRFCAQSARYTTGAARYGLIDRDEAISIALDNEAHGVHRLSLVTSGHSVDKETWKKLAELYAQINEKTSMELCASMGFLDQDRAEQLAQELRSRQNPAHNDRLFWEFCKKAFGLVIL